jgi:hypothetical protein
MDQYLGTAEIGTIYLRITKDGGQKWYVCSSVSITMRLNALPTASVVVGSGSSIRYGHVDNADNSAEDILQYVMDASHNNTDGFLDCDIIEVLPFHKDDKQRESVILFKGCIVAASLVYRTGATTVRAVRIECMNNACRLMAQPLSAYNNTAGSYIVDALTYRTGRQQMPNQKTTVKEYGMYSIGSLTDVMVTGFTKDLTKHKDIATKITYLADAIAMLSTHVIDTTDPAKTLKDMHESLTKDDILGISKYIKSDYTLDYEHLALNDVTDNKFDSVLCAALLAGLKTNTVLDTIMSAIISPEFMLNLVPKWNNDDFMMEIQPSRAWESTPSMRLYLSDISEMNSSYRPLEHINDPEIFAVNFTEAVNFNGNQGLEGQPSAVMGAYSTNPEVAEWLKERFTNDSAQRAVLTDRLKNYKWRIYSAPNWLKVSHIQTKRDEDAKKEDEQKASVENQRTQPKEKSELQQQIEDSQKAMIQDFVAAEQIADRIAKALYIHIHGESNTAQVALLPDLRFGKTGGNYVDTTALEDHIGELIDILPADDGIDDHLAIRGIIEALQFNYTAGQSGSCSYTMTMSRVRPIKQEAEDLVCPLYVKSSAK